MSQPPYPPPGQEPYPQSRQGAASSTQRPKEVESSFYLWIASIVVGLVSTFLVFSNADFRAQTRAEILAEDPSFDPALVDQALTIALVVGLVIGLAFLAVYLLFVFKMRAGRNWARIVLAVLGGLNVLTTLIGIGGLPGLLLVLTALQVLILAGAIVLMFMPNANPWFRPRPS